MPGELDFTDGRLQPSKRAPAECPTGAEPLKSQRLVPQQLDALADVIRREIVPALLLEFKSKGYENKEHKLSFEDADRQEYTSSVLALPPKALTVLTQHFIDIGFTTEQVLIDLLAPTARHLGVMWERDEINFVDVTIAVQKLQHVLNALCDRDRLEEPSGERPTALFVPAPGEAHTFGLVVMSEMLRRRGWDVFGGLPVPLDVIISKVSERPYALVGFSISAETLLKPTASAIRKVRKKSANRHVKVLVGGRVCGDNPNMAADLGADGAFHDAADACDFADMLFGESARRDAHP